MDNKDIKILISITGIDIFSAMLISTEIVNVKRFSTPWKLGVMQGWLLLYQRIIRKNKNRKNNKTRLTMVKMDTCSMCTYCNKI